MNEFPVEFMNLGGWGVVAWVLYHLISKVMPILQEIVRSLDGLKNAVENQTKNLCKFDDCPLTPRNESANLPLSKSDTGKPPVAG